MEIVYTEDAMIARWLVLPTLFRVLVFSTVEGSSSSAATTGVRRLGYYSQPPGESHVIEQVREDADGDDTVVYLHARLCIGVLAALAISNATDNLAFPSYDTIVYEIIVARPPSPSDESGSEASSSCP